MQHCCAFVYALPFHAYVHWLTFISAVALAQYHPVTFQYIPSRYIALHGWKGDWFAVNCRFVEYVKIRFHHIPSMFCSKHIQHLPVLIVRNGCIAWCLGVRVRLEAQSFLPAACPALAPGGAWASAVEITTIHYLRIVSVNRCSALI
jgi:hypothetical protein